MLCCVMTYRWLVPPMAPRSPSWAQEAILISWMPKRKPLFVMWKWTVRCARSASSLTPHSLRQVSTQRYTFGIYGKWVAVLLGRLLYISMYYILYIHLYVYNCFLALDSSMKTECARQRWMRCTLVQHEATHTKTIWLWAPSPASSPCTTTAPLWWALSARGPHHGLAWSSPSWILLPKQLRWNFIRLVNFWPLLPMRYNNYNISW